VFLVVVLHVLALTSKPNQNNTYAVYAIYRFKLENKELLYLWQRRTGQSSVSVPLGQRTKALLGLIVTTEIDNIVY